MKTLALTASMLMFGLIFLQVLAYLIGVNWTRAMTIFFYFALASWFSIFAWLQRSRLQGLNNIDILFLSYILVILISISVKDTSSLGVLKYSAFLPFMVLMPYLCGRLMSIGEINQLQNIISFAGMAIIIPLMIDRFILTSSTGGRWAFFGQDHSPLTIGFILATAMIAFFMRALLDPINFGSHLRISWLWSYAMSLLMASLVVWVSARGWLIAGLIGCAVSCVAIRRPFILRGILLLLGLLAIVGLTLTQLSKVDKNFGVVYSIARNTNVTSLPAQEINCQSILNGDNSIEIRVMLYKEAMEMFMQNPVFGVGAAKFGDNSCAGSLGFPHSTILQGFSELGVIGGVLFVLLLGFSTLRLLCIARSLRQDSKWAAAMFILALLAASLFSDQIYGNYFMATETWLLIGVIASLDANNKVKKSSYA